VPAPRDGSGRAGRRCRPRSKVSPLSSAPGGCAAGPAAPQGSIGDPVDLADVRQKPRHNRGQVGLQPPCRRAGRAHWHWRRSSRPLQIERRMNVEPSAFIDKSGAPARDALEATLGAAYRWWEALEVRLAIDNDPVLADWTYSGRRHGWALRLKHRDRPIVYLTPLAGRFRANLAIPERAMTAALEADLPELVLAIVASAPVYVEGRAVRFEVATTALCELSGPRLTLTYSTPRPRARVPVVPHRGSRTRDSETATRSCGPMRKEPQDVVLGGWYRIPDAQ